MKKITIYILSTLFSIGLFAAKDTSTNSNSFVPSKKTNLGNCDPSTTQIDLDINNIRARILGGGDFWWDGVNTAKYEYPKVDQTTGTLSKNVLFAGALWFTGYENGSLRCSAQTFRNQGHDFWTGPLKLGGEIPYEVCSNFDHHFVVYGDEISKFLADFQAGGGSISESEIPDNIKYWPGKGNEFLQNNSTLSKWYFNEGALAPFFDADGNEIYSPSGGDYPIIKLDTSGTEGYYADQMIFWVINDFGNTHSRTNGTAIGVQVNCLAFAFQTSDELNDMTFYTYEIFKKTAGDLEQTYMGLFVDPDLGGATDDFVGCDTVRSLGFCYNADNSDDDYGSGPPIVGIDYFEGPLDDNENELGLSSFMYFINNGPPALTDPSDAGRFRNLQEGKTTMGDALQASGVGLGPAPFTRYAFYGNPSDPASGWSECEAGNNPGDRRFVQNSGPFTLKSSKSQRISVGVMVASTNPNTYNGCPDIEKVLGVADNKAQFLFDNNFAIVDGPDAPNLEIREMSNRLLINLVNKPSSNNYGENYSIEAASAPTGAVDSTYKFEGYLLYQLKDNTVTAKELNDPSKAKLVLQSDIKNDVSNVFNYVKDDVSGTYVPDLKVLGKNEGISRSISITEDAFADGDNALINYKTYYFAVVAYAYNNFRQFNQLDSNNITSQVEQYLQGRKNFNVYSAIPHNIESEIGGTTLNAEYGQGLNVKRLEGKGNGGKNLDLTQETIDAIVNNGFKDILEYEPLFDPIGVKVVDPLKIQNVDFELVIQDSANLVTDSSYWKLFVSKDGQFVDTINSRRLMDRPYEQLINDYGIAINVGKPLPISTNLENDEEVYDYITSSITYNDETKNWLSFVKDGSNGGVLSPSNWLRDGNFKSIDFPYLLQVYDAHQYDNLPAYTDVFYDSVGVFSNIIDGGFSPYALAANYKKENIVCKPPITDNICTPNSVYGPAFLWDVYDVPQNSVCFNPINTLERLQSVNIVLTSNKDLWSKCVVFETSEDANFAVGNSNKGQIRNQASIDKNGNETGVDIGYSYFPGYAINVETGERLNIAFGESSDRVDNNGNDMIWNPTSKLYDALTDIPKTESRKPVFGGKHFIYVFETKYDECNAIHSTLTNPANYNNTSIPTDVEDIYKQIMYTSIPYVSSDFKLNSLADGLIPDDVTLKIRVERPYDLLTTSESNGVNSNNSMPRYSFSTIGLAPTTNDKSVAESALDDIRVVPNPYYAYSTYEVSPNSNVVKITNLPDACEVSIFTLDGKLVRKYNRSVGSSNNQSNRQDLSLGQVAGVANLNNSIDWNLKNHKDIPVASGVYLIYIKADGIGEKVVKSAVFIRPPDVTNF